MTNIGPYTIDDYMHLVRSFHGSVAPGLLIGGFMVDKAMEVLPEGVIFDCICETRACLPDAVQLLTPCTIGNGWLRVLDFGRFALCLYDKYTGEGVRVFLDPGKLQDWPEIKSWFFKLKSKRDQDASALRDQIIEAGPAVLSVQRVQVDIAPLGRKDKGSIATCPICGEAYPSRDGEACLACRGDSPYRRDAEVNGVRPGLKVVPCEKTDKK